MTAVEQGPISVRRLAPGEVELFQAVRLAALRDSPDAFGETLEVALQSDWHTRTVRGSTLSDRAAYVAVSAEHAIGMVFVNCALPPEPAFLGGMWVDQAFRRHGIGRSLVECALEFLRGAGQVQVSLWVTSTHDEIFSFYESLGFKKTGAISALRDGSDVAICELRRTIG